MTSTTTTTTITRTDPYEYMGCDVTDLTDTDEMLAAGGADFDVTLGPVSVTTPNGVIDSPEHRAIVRTDTDEVFGIHSKGYTIVQYRDVFQSARDALAASGIDGTVETCGVIDGGRQFYSSILIDRGTVDPGGIADKINTRLNLITSHDGTLGICYAFGSFRVVCSNQSPTIRGSQHRVTAKHTKNVQDRINVGLKALAMSAAAHKQFVDEATELQRQPSSEEKVLRTIEKLWGKAADMDEGAKRTRLENRTAAIMSIYRSDTCVGAVGHTRWAEYNAFTEYLDHARLIGGTDPAGKMAKTTIVPGSWVEKQKVAIGRMLIDA